MPTPIPIRPATAGANSGTSRSAASAPIETPEMPRLKSATSSGRPAATTDPKAVSRITAAAISAAASGLAPPWALRIRPPPSSIRSPLPVAASASSIRLFPVSVSSFQEGCSSSSRVSPIVPPRSTLFPYTTLFRSSRRACARKRSTRASTAGWRAPAGASQTTLIASPELPGKRAATRSAARFDSEPGVEKSASNSPATRGTSATSAARATTQASSIRPRRRKASSARRARRPDAGARAAAVRSALEARLLVILGLGQLARTSFNVLTFYYIRLNEWRQSRGGEQADRRCDPHLPRRRRSRRRRRLRVHGDQPHRPALPRHPRASGTDDRGTARRGEQAHERGRHRRPRPHGAHGVHAPCARHGRPAARHGGRHPQGARARLGALREDRGEALRAARALLGRRARDPARLPPRAHRDRSRAGRRVQGTPSPTSAKGRPTGPVIMAAGAIMVVVLLATGLAFGTAARLASPALSRAIGSTSTAA